MILPPPLIKALSAIAVGTNNTLASVSQVVTSAALGQVKSLKQLGIVAKATGDQIEVSYKGQKSVIDNTSESIMKYINDISKNNFAETLNFQMRGMTGATKNLSDAWSDMWTAIATGDVGGDTTGFRWNCQSVQGRIFHNCQWFIKFMATVRRFFLKFI